MGGQVQLSLEKLARGSLAVHLIAPNQLCHLSWRLGWPVQGCHGSPCPSCHRSPPARHGGGAGERDPGAEACLVSGRWRGRRSCAQLWLSGHPLGLPGPLSWEHWALMSLCGVWLPPRLSPQVTRIPKSPSALSALGRGSVVAAPGPRSRGSGRGGISGGLRASVWSPVHSVIDPARRVPWGK